MISSSFGILRTRTCITISTIKASIKHQQSHHIRQPFSLFACTSRSNPKREDRDQHVSTQTQSLSDVNFIG